jgi:anti-anti-sigma factor
MPAAPFLAVEKADDEIVVTLAGPRLAQENAPLVAGLLFRLAEEAVRPRLLLDCRNVLSVTAAGLGRLVALHKGVRSLGGQLALCNVAPHIAEVFEVTHLTRVLEVRRASAGVVGKDGAGHEALKSVSGREGYPVACAEAGSDPLRACQPF